MLDKAFSPSSSGCYDSSSGELTSVVGRFARKGGGYFQGVSSWVELLRPWPNSQTYLSSSSPTCFFIYSYAVLGHLFIA